MKKTIKITLWSIVGCIVAFIFYLNYQTHFSKEARKGKINIENIKKVKKGMEVNMVIEIMGNPDIIEYCDLDSTSKGYSYNTNDESFVHVTVCFDSTMAVQKTYYPE